MPKIKEVALPSGEVRYRFVVDVPSKGSRKQITKTYDTLEEAERQLAALQQAADRWRNPDGEFAVADLFAEGRCHPTCVFAWGSEEGSCECVCEGRYHGRLSELRCDWAYLEAAPVRARRPQRKSGRPLDPALRDRILGLRAEAASDFRHRYQPAVYVRERLAEDGVSMTTIQINNVFAYARRTEQRGR